MGQGRALGENSSETGRPRPSLLPAAASPLIKNNKDTQGRVRELQCVLSFTFKS